MPTSTPTRRTDCYIAEQKDGVPATTRLNLPAAILAAQTATYNVHYGRKAVFASQGFFDTTIPVAAGIWDAATIDALVSGTTSGAKTLTLDIGIDGAANDVTVPFTGGAPISLLDTDVKAALNAYYQLHGGASTANVPVRITLSGAGTVLLTNLELTPTASTDSKVRITAGTYGQATLTLAVGTSGSGHLDLSVDVGDNGTIDWTGSGNYTYPATITTGNVATGLNAYLTGKTGEVDVPVRIMATPSLERKITGYSATRSPLPDLDLGTVTFGTPSPVEGATVTVSVPITNTGSASAGTSVTFFGVSPTFGRIYLGSSFLASVGSSGNASIPWNTLGFTGATTVEAVIDYYADVAESNENNNSSSSAITIATRPDLKVEAATASDPGITLSIPQPVTAEAVSVTVNVKNGGQASAPASTLKLYDGDPGSGGTLIGSSAIGSLAPGVTTQAAIAWTTPATPGPRQLVARVDDGTPQTVQESDEGNNTFVFPAYIGFRTPIEINSGAGVGPDPLYDANRGWGADDQDDTDLELACVGGVDTTFRYDPTASELPGVGGVRYRFDHLQPGHFYHLDLVLQECSPIGRVQAVEVNGVDIATGIDLSDGEPHRLSLLLDPASYADHEIIIRVHETSGLGAGAIVNSIELHDIDYRYSDSGASAATDPSYASSTGTKRYGYVVGGSAVSAWGSLPGQSARQNSLTNAITYRFDGLVPAKAYQINGTFYHGTAQTRTLQFQIDAAGQAPLVTVPNSTRVVQSIVVPPGAYAPDGSILVTIVRTDTSALPVINEISLEEITQQGGFVVPPASCYALTLLQGAGGTAGATPPPDCPGDATKYLETTSVSLAATPAPGYMFSGWTGSTSSALNPLVVLMSGPKSYTANFSQCFALTVAAVNGSVGRSPGANCDSGTKFSNGTQVQLTATPAANFAFDHWSGDLNGNQNPATVSMTATRSVTAHFVECFTLTKNAVSNGSIDIQTPTNCAGDKYRAGTSVSVQATPSNGSESVSRGRRSLRPAPWQRDRGCSRGNSGDRG